MSTILSDTERSQLCPTCIRDKYSPFRSWDEQGRIIHGCIDDFHTGHLTPISASNSWHYRKEARVHRASVAKHLKELTRTLRKPKVTQ